jgi:NAD(P)-dependent dehydrogenase (short-subunit alcohol dehydrogenase family)
MAAGSTGHPAAGAARGITAARGRPGRQVALVTGAAQGLGRAIALRLAAEGFAVAANDIGSDIAGGERLTGLAAEIGGIAVPADISAPGAAPAMVRAVAGALGPVDVLVANAAAMAMSPFLDADPASGGTRSTSTSPATSGSSRRCCPACGPTGTAAS